MDKLQLRKWMRTQLSQISASEISRQSQTLVSILMSCMSQYHVWAIYLPLQTEPDLTWLYQHLSHHGHVLVVPHLIDGHYVRCRYDAQTQLDHTGAYPQIINPVIYQGPVDVILVPGLAFDHWWHRLGRGGWWYDRLLSQIQHIHKIGLCFDIQYLEMISTEPHDIQMDQVLYG